MKVLLVVYDNDSYISFFPLGLAYIASVCRKAGHEVEIYNQDMYHHEDSHLTDYLDKNKFDIIGFGVVGGYYQYRKLLKLSEAINKSNNRPFYIIGGHGPSPEAEYFLKKTKADVVVIGEGEDTTIELLSAIEAKKDLSSINGIAFMKNNEFVMTPKRELIQDIDKISLPAWDLFPVDYYSLLRKPHASNSDRYMSVLSGRGCTFKCNFCYRMDEGFRPRSADSIIEEISILQKDYFITYVEFLDELLMNSEQRTIELCESFLKAKLKFKWMCNGRLNYAKPDVLKLMKKAGCVFINYGIESLDDKALRVMKKGLTVKQITTGIENTLAADISPGYNVIFGNIGETEQSLKWGVDFLLKYDDHSQLRTIRPVTPYPGSPLYYHAIEKGLLKDVEDFYENKHTNSDLMTVNFTDLSEDDYYRILCEANTILIDKYYTHQQQKALEITQKLYHEKNVAFRGFRQT